MPLVISVLAVVVAAELVVALLVEEVAVRVDEAAIRVHIKPVLVVHAASWVSLFVAPTIATPVLLLFIVLLLFAFEMGVRVSSAAAVALMLLEMGARRLVGPYLLRAAGGGACSSGITFWRATFCG